MGRYVVDIDMTLANNQNRAEVLKRQDIPASQRWGMFFQPKGMQRDLLIPAASVLNKLMAAGNDITFVTGRPERTREATMNWLSNNFSHYSPEAYPLYMKENGNIGPTAGWKAKKLKELFTPDDDFTFIDDDDNNRNVISEAFPLATVLHPDGGWKEISDKLTTGDEPPSEEASGAPDEPSTDETYEDME